MVDEARLFERLLTSLGGASGELLADARSADAFVDQALAVVRTEEPSLQRLLAEDEDLRRVVRVHTLALYALINHDARHGYDGRRTMKRTETMQHRMQIAAAWRAVVAERMRG